MSDIRRTSNILAKAFAKVALVDNLNRLGTMTLSEIAGLIEDDWKKVNYGARPYLDAMYSLRKISDDYGMDSGSSIVAYFLSNASSWKGDVAKTVKKELNKRLKSRRSSIIVASELLKISRDMVLSIYAPNITPAIQKVIDLAKRAKFSFRTPGMKALWDDELKGQITDGMWETVPGKIGDLFWSEVNTSSGGSTGVSGNAPYSARVGFKFTSLIPQLGDRMMKILRSKEPNATDDDLVVYLKEIEKAVKSVKKVDIQAPDDASGGDNASDLDKARHELEWRFELKNPKIMYEQGMIGDGGGRSNKYHYFVIFKDRATGDFIGGNAYGSFGSRPKSVELIRSPDLNAVKKKVQSKMRSKSSKYSEMDL